MSDAFFSSSKPRKLKPPETLSRKNPAQSRKRKRRDPSKHVPPKLGVANGRSRNKNLEDEELSDKTDDHEGGIDDLDLKPVKDDEPMSELEDDDETPAEKRLRLAHLYLDSVKESLADGEFDAAEIDKELIATRLKQDVAEHSGKLYRFVADSLDLARVPKSILKIRGHKLSVTAAIASESGKYLFTSGKEGSIIRWNLPTGKRLSTFAKRRPCASKKLKETGEEVKGHTDEVLALSISTDGRYLASAGKDRRLCLWDVEQGEWIKGFCGKLGHKDTISALSFRKGSHQLYTASFDRTVKVYDMSPSIMGYVETLFGHQDQVLGLDTLRNETCVTVGGRDKTVRFWKIVDETQLVFRGGGRSRLQEVLEGGLGVDEDDDDADREKGDWKAKQKETKFVEGSLECVAMIDEMTFVSGGDSGSISLWITAKKKPVFVQPLAHGMNEVVSETEGVIRTPRWVTALASLRYSDVVASGSWDGDIRMWKFDSSKRNLSFLGVIPAPGVINSLQLISPPKEFYECSSWTMTKQRTEDGEHPLQPRGHVPSLLLVAGVGKEHRLGRWLNIKEGVSNCTIVVALSPRTSESS